MTPDDFRATLQALGWTPNGLAAIIGNGCHRNTSASWGTGRATVPQAIAEWLRDLAEHHAARPVPDWRTRSVSS